MVFDFNTPIALQVDMIQVFASKERWPGYLQPETCKSLATWPEYDLSTFAKFLRVLRVSKRQMN